MTVTKAQLSESVRDRVGFGKSTSSRLINSLFEIMKTTLAEGEDILVSGFGKFCINGKKPGPKKRDSECRDHEHYASKNILFKCSPALREKINRD